MAGFVFTVLTGIYFLPTIIAAARGNRNTSAIGVLNFFAGWTFIGWIGALVWALCAERECQHVVYVNVPYGAQQTQYIDRSGPPMNVTPPRRAG